MPEFKIVNLDQMQRNTHFVEAIDKEEALRIFRAGHYGRVIEIEEVKPKKKCPHCGKDI